ncbi:DUF2487 family protein [Cohnella faecalis]|uniref:DUF2487 family protein n=1 Tax=Cohnella faecalis TaxID=2315694 RepID=A0A398CVV7_9BACL|nr:DUF2487 family protein [Cohnella faecalis]RIE04668.1 DUF2487 family protein [Cohnella faecalis]
MRFSELNEAEWPDLQPYMDTCLLPVTGLDGTESPWEAKEKVGAAGDWLSPVEYAFKGRTVTMPAYHYYDGGEEALERLRAACRQLKRSGFRYLIIVCGQPNGIAGIPEADLILQPEAEGAAADESLIRKSVSALWKEAAFASDSR